MGPQAMTLTAQLSPIIFFLSFSLIFLSSANTFFIYCHYTKTQVPLSCYTLRGTKRDAI